jgi:Tol biopolymer transport system component
VFFLVFVFAASSMQEQDKTADFPVLKGPYFGQNISEDKPLLFAPGIISLEGTMVHDTPVFSPDGKEIYWGEFSTNPNHTSIKYSKMVDNIWTTPELVSFSSLDSYGDGCPFMMQGGEILYFSSFRALEKGGKSGRERIWYVKRQGSGWGEPQPVGQDVNTMDLHWQTSVSANRNLFFSTDQGVMRSRFTNGKHQKPEKITLIMNSKYIGGTPYIAPDESYFIFSSDKLPHGLGKRDLYIGYRKKDGTWTDPIHLGDTINTIQHDLCPIVTYDGKYLLYLSWQKERPGVYWFPAYFIEELKPKELM